MRKTGVVVWMVACAAMAAPAAGAAEPRGVVLEVSAGAHARRATPVELLLPDAWKELADAPRLERLSDGRPVPVQRVPGPSPAVAWLLDEPLPAGASRRYRLAPAREAAPKSSATGGPRLVEDARGATIELGGRPVLSYHAALVEPPAGIDRLYARSGFIHPLATRAGRVVTDDFPKDHAHQHGLFFAWVNTSFEGRHVDFWNQHERTGRVSHAALAAKGDGPVFAAFSARLRHEDLTAPGGPAPVLDETWTVRVYDVPGTVVADFESVQECVASKPLLVLKYHYGGLGLRGTSRWFDPAARGEAAPDPARSGRSDFLTSEGRRRADGNHTAPRWVDLSGEVDGGVAGVTVLDHPRNFRFPQPVRLHPNKPYFCFAPMVAGAFEIAPGKPYASRYRLILHDGPPSPEEIERSWADYAEPPSVRIVAE